ncbi:hypothetical protein PAEPH01_1731 [Pancytospora epiphaga]|nr:hypothetical protein PAEPH01_1731 [Pancytospora epiphaga]
MITQLFIIMSIIKAHSKTDSTHHAHKHHHPDDKHRHIGRHNNKDILSSAISHSMAKNKYTPEEQQKYVGLGNSAVHGDKGALDTLENEGIISHGEHKAIKAGAEGDIHNKRLAANHNRAHHGGDNHRGHPGAHARTYGDKHSLRHVNDKKKRMADRIASAHGNKAAQDRLLGRNAGYGDEYGHGHGHGHGSGTIDPSTAPGGAFGKYGVGPSARAGADAGARAGAIAGAQAGEQNGIGAEAGARIGAAAGRRAGGRAGDHFPGRPSKAGELAGGDAGAKAVGMDYRGFPGGKRARKLIIRGIPGEVLGGPIINNQVLGTPLETIYEHMHDQELEQPPQVVEARTPTDDANDAANQTTGEALEAGADPYTANYMGHMVGEDVGRRSYAVMERDRRLARDRAELAGKAAREEMENEHQSRINNKSINDKARALEDHKTHHEEYLKRQMAYGVPLDADKIAGIRASHDNANIQLLKDKAEAYLAEDRDKQKDELAQRVREGDPEAKNELARMAHTEAMAYGTMNGDPIATEAFASEVASNAAARNGLRELRPIEDVGDDDTLAAVAAQAGETASKQTGGARAHAEAVEDQAQRADAAERRAAHIANLTGARGKRAANILAHEQKNEDEDAADAAGWAVAQQAAAEGAPPAVAAAQGAKAKRHAMSKLAAMANGASEGEAEEAGRQAANAVASPADSGSYENQLVDQEAQRNEAHDRVKSQALRDGKGESEAEAAGAKAAEDTARAQAAANQAANAAAAAGMARREAAARARSAATEAENAAREEAAAAEEAGAANEAAAMPLAAARERDAAEAAEARALAQEEAAQREKEHRSSNHQKVAVTDFMKHGKEERRRKEKERVARDNAKRREAEEKKRAKEAVKEKRRVVPSIPEVLAQQRRDAAREHAEAIADAGNQAEANRAAKLAYENVKGLNGSEEQARSEAAKAHELKRREQENERALREKANRELLHGQMEEKEAAKMAKHLSKVQGGKGHAGGGGYEKADGGAMEEEATNSVVDAVSDDSSHYPLNNAEIKLPMSCIVDVPAKTKEEEDIKQSQIQLRDILRNKVTSKDIATGLGVIKGKDGYFNVPESAKRVNIKNGKVYYTPKGYNKMKQAGKDTSGLESKFSTPDNSPLPGEPVYYEADASGMNMGMDNGCPENVLTNGQEKLDISEASKITVKEGNVEMEPWEKFSANIRPHVYAAGEQSDGAVSEAKRKEFERQRRIEEERKRTSVEIFKGSKGQDIVQITPSYGTRSQLKAEDAFNKIENEGSGGSSEASGSSSSSGKRRELNIGESEGHGSALNRFINEAHGGASKYSEFLSETNPLNGKRNEGLSRIISEGSSSFSGESRSESVSRRDEHSEENILFNRILDSLGPTSKILNISEKDLRKRISTISPDTWKSYLDYYKKLAGNQKLNLLLAKMDSQPFYKEFENTFPEFRPSTVYRAMGPAGNAVTHLPDMTTAKIISMNPITDVKTASDHNAPVVNQVVDRKPVSPGSVHPPNNFLPRNQSGEVRREAGNVNENMVPILNATRNGMEIANNNNNGDPYNDYTTNQPTSPKRPPTYLDNWGLSNNNRGARKTYSDMGTPANPTGVRPPGPGQKKMIFSTQNDIIVQGQRSGPRTSAVPMGLPRIGSGATPGIGSGATPRIGSGATPGIGSGATPGIGSGAAPSSGAGLKNLKGILPRLGAKLGKALSKSAVPVHPTNTAGSNSG